MALLLWAASCDRAPGRPALQPVSAPATRLADTITVMSYNVENLFDLVNNGHEYPEFKPGRCNWTEETYRIKLGNTADVIAAARPDIVVLVEIENENVVRDLRAALATRSARYNYVALGNEPNSSSTIPVILSKYPIARSQGLGVQMESEEHTRNILEAAIALGRDTLTIFANHWPSQRWPESQRIVCARVLAGRLRQLPAGTDYLIAGDLNVNYDECEILRNRRRGMTDGTTSINHVLGTVVSRPMEPSRFVDERSLMQGDELRHYDPWLELAPDARGSLAYQKHWQTIDHLLLPRALYDTAGISYVDNSFAVFTWYGRLLMDGKPYRWKTAYRGKKKVHVGEGFSDHLPITAKFRAGAFVTDSVGGTPVRVANQVESGSATEVRRGAASSSSKRGAGRASRERAQVRVRRVAGWEAPAPEFTAASTQGPAPGWAAAVKIDGLSATENVTVAARPIRVAAAAGRTLNVQVRGHGKLSIRVRGSGNKWCYFNAPAFSAGKSARYAEAQIDEWKLCVLPLPSDTDSDTIVEVEIRAGKGIPFSFEVAMEEGASGRADGGTK
jgi:endonuclease/exonuclease/phosphatase family metal-dependent hydrolase